MDNLSPRFSSSPSVSWEDRFPKEERGDPPPTWFKVPVFEGLPALMGRVLAQSAVDLTDDGACIVLLMNYGFTAREASGDLREVQRIAIGLRVGGKV